MALLEDEWVAERLVVTWRLAVVAIIVLGVFASCCAVAAQAIRGFDEGMAWE